MLVFLLERLANFTTLLLFIKNLFNTKFKLGPFPSKKHLIKNVISKVRGKYASTLI